MPRKLFKRWIPDASRLGKANKGTWFSALAEDPNLLHLTRHSVSLAFFVGLFVAFLPLPGQVVVAALVAFRLRCNLPIAVTLVWVSNPLTYPLIVIAAYKFGAYILLLPPRKLNIELSLSWLQSEFLIIWQPLLLGSLCFSLFFGCLGYVSIQWLWRWQTISRWEERKKARQLKQKLKKTK